MSMLRQFIIAPSLARLIQKERGGERVVEGYFPEQPHRNAYVQVEGDRSSLILMSDGPDGPIELRAEIPSAHAQALLAAAAGQVDYVRTKLEIGSYRIQLQHFVEPGLHDLVAVEWSDGEEFYPMPWLASEVTGDTTYQARQMALNGLPALADVDLTNEALDSLLDILENRPASLPVPSQAPASEDWSIQRRISLLPSKPAELAEPDRDIDEMGLEDDVIRDLARSLRPQRR
jgi:CYTH domain-containing protein